mmetsp:Transcript_33490/g.48572  ORF Transcript_33490/g.48572 Transcript_33490/m.48572 type:complete len:196 (+) Transcript_33490:18-605(+)|eukprot:CAMPEP_0170069074 /NCGR_PEP_ID=MMETSP0019_2-20121128/7863_1 /TAXON_ID=98059 /ORGANISM="Dinobryon sp., Strain UTEXLB2267" /LENGTH=195 /DNA_ID=CAMNT_0010276983 /DNA_START=13 /DNA_END=600 /DNA_ORIENTATION=+
MSDKKSELKTHLNSESKVILDHVKEVHAVDMNETQLRYAAYSAGLARIFRYLAFSSDFGEALRPVVSSRIVNASYSVAIGYCFADVFWEGYKHHKRGNITEKHEPLTLTQVVVERATFQAVASMIVPTIIIHTSVDVTKKLCKRIGRFQKWGPSIVGLSIIPLLPLYLDHPVEHALDWTFKKYGPWAGSAKPHSD